MMWAWKALLIVLVLPLATSILPVYAQDTTLIDFDIQPLVESVQLDEEAIIPLQITLARKGSSSENLRVDLVITVGQGVIFVSEGDFVVDNAQPQASLNTSVAAEARVFDLAVQALPDTIGRVAVMSTMSINGVRKPNSDEAALFLDFGGDLIDYMETQPEINGFRIAQRHIQDLQIPTDRSEIYVYVENIGTSPETYEVTAETFSQVVIGSNTTEQQRTLAPIELLPSESRLARIPLQIADNARLGRYSVLMRVKTASTAMVTSLLLPIAYGRAEFDAPQSAPSDLVENDLYLDTVILRGDSTDPIRLSRENEGELWIWIENTRLVAQARTVRVEARNDAGNLLFAENSESANSVIVIEDIELGPFEGVVIPIRILPSEGTTSGIYSARVTAIDSDGGAASERNVQVSVED